jgi:hypothetical protein
MTITDATSINSPLLILRVANIPLPYFSVLPTLIGSNVFPPLPSVKGHTFCLRYINFLRYFRLHYLSYVQAFLFALGLLTNRTKL